MKRIFYLAGMVILTACGKNEKEYDATGTFEATETTVSAEHNKNVAHKQHFLKKMLFRANILM